MCTALSVVALVTHHKPGLPEIPSVRDESNKGAPVLVLGAIKNNKEHFSICMAFIFKRYRIVNCVLLVCVCVLFLNTRIPHTSISVY